MNNLMNSDYKKLRDEMIRARKNRDYIKADKIKHQIKVMKYRLQTQ